MPCFRPNIMYLKKNFCTNEFLEKRFINSKSSDFPGYEHFDRQNLIFKELENGSPIKSEYIRVPCRQCVGCVENYAREWAVRSMCEAEYYDENYFITLTYDDYHLPLDPVLWKRTGEVFDPFEAYDFREDGLPFGTLCPAHMEKFKKDLLSRLRDRYGHTGIRFYYSGEYGSSTFRPHYHGLFFNLPLDKFAHEGFHVYKVTKNGDILYTHDLISEVWPRGFHTIAALTPETCAYTARYVQKKLYRSDYDGIYTLRGQVPEYSLMSRRPGLGKQYYLDHKDEIYKNDEIIFKGSKNKVAPIKPPHFFDNLYGIDSESEFLAIKDKRKELSFYNTQNANRLTTLPEADRLKIQEQTKLNTFTALLRDKV